MASPSDRDQLVELLGRYADIADTKDFDILPRTVFTDPVTLDFESLTGQRPAETPLSALMPAFRTAFSPFTATHHAVTGHQVVIDGDRGVIHAHVRAEHWLPESLV